MFKKSKGQTELPEFMMKLIAVLLFTVFIIGGILHLSQFKVQVNENSYKRLAIDFGENVLAAPCLTEKKGLFSAAKIHKEIEYMKNHPEDKDGISCLNASALTAIKIKTASEEWDFGAGSKTFFSLSTPMPSSALEFPAALELDYSYTDNFENWLSETEKIWNSVTEGVSVSEDYSHSPSHSLKIDGSKSCGIKNCGVIAEFDKRTGNVSVWFYDKDPDANSEMYAVAGNLDNYLAIGPDNPSGKGGKNYYYRVPKVHIGDKEYFETSVPRSKGWHEFKWVFSGLKMEAFIDSKKIYETSDYGNFSIVALRSRKSGGIDGYFDDVKIESSGKTVPAKLLVVASASSECNSNNEGLNCYNCLNKKDCEAEGCRWEGECKP